MAVKTDLDTLVLNIEVNDKKDGKSAAHTINELTRSLAKFQATIQGLNTTVFRNKFSAMATAVKPFISQLEQAKDKIADLNKLAKTLDAQKIKELTAVGQIGKQKVNTNTGGVVDNKTDQGGGVAPLATSDTNNAVNNIQQISNQYGKLSKSITSASGQQQLFFERIEGNNRVITKFTADTDKNGKVIEDSIQKVNEVSQNAAGDGLKSFLLSIKRIALYRAIRTTLKTIVSGTKEGIRNITAFDAGYRQTMTQLTSSFTIMQNSLGAVVMPLLQLVTPLVQGIAKAVGTLANGISYLAAKLKGQSSWVKVNIDYLKEYNKQVNKLSYDEFSVLSGADDTSGMFTQESMDESSWGGILADCSALSAVLAGIATTLGIIGASKIIGLLTGGKIIAAIKGLLASTLTFSATISGLAVGIGVLVAGLVYFIASFKDMSTVAKIVIPILAVLAATLTGLAVAHAAAKAGLAAPAMAGITAAAIAAGIVLAAGTAIAVSQHANGGMFEGTGTIYHQAGEAGAEIVATGSRGTGVANVQQIEEAFYNALYKYNAAKQVQSNGDVVIKIDGRELARQQVRNNADALRQNYNIKLEPR